MDFERAAIQTLFYDYPIETAVKYLHLDNDSYLSVFDDIARWRCSSFTMSEWKLLEVVLKDNWLKVNNDMGHPHIANILQLLPNIAEKVLTLDKRREPLVIFDNLFRWRDMTLYIGEDIMIAAYLAKRDIEDGVAVDFVRNTFLWDDILRHNNERLNALLHKGLSDVHSHYHATADIFHLNWIAIMNGQKEDFCYNHFTQNKDLNFYQRDTQQIYTMQQLCLSAAYLRTLLYQQIILEKDVDDNEWKIAIGILNDATFATSMTKEVLGSILNVQQGAIADYASHVFDYAIRKTPNTLENCDNKNIVYHGERMLFYKFFKRWFVQNPQIWHIAPYVYLYVLIKTHVRRELVETNKLYGFENFAEYQKDKIFAYGNFIKNRIAPKLIAQTALNHKDDMLETRVGPNSFSNILQLQFDKSIFTDNTVIEELPERLSFVIHFIKERDKAPQNDSPRYLKVRNDVRKSITKILQVFEDQDKSDEHIRPRIVGIDAAGSELKCRPEVYAHVFRYAKKRGLLGRTYHVGEDFYDLVDGLRAIDEAVRFLDLDSDSRIGHALALSTDAKKYYEGRHFKMIITQQDLLDNCIWLYYRAAEWDIEMPQSLNVRLLEIATTMYYNIGYSQSFNVLDYWQSMLLRGDAPERCAYTDLWERTRLCKGEEYENARHNSNAKSLWNNYLYNFSIKQKGMLPCTEQYPEKIIPTIQRVQQELIRIIAEKGIAIECCPSSNLKIGRFSRYDEHPIFKFRPIDKDTHMPLLNVSINTDDRGVFATSLYNEYSLIALAMMKMKDENGHRKYNDETIYDYIDRIRLNGQQQRFK